MPARDRVLALLAAASIAGAAAPVAPAAARAHAAGARWSRATCTRMYIAWYDRHFNPSHALTPGEKRRVTAYLRALERAHHCTVGG